MLMSAMPPQNRRGVLWISGKSRHRAARVVWVVEAGITGIGPFRAHKTAYAARPRRNGSGDVSGFMSRV